MENQQILDELSRIEPRLDQFALVAPSDTVAFCQQVLTSDALPYIRANAIFLATLTASAPKAAELVQLGLADEKFAVRVAASRAIFLVAQRNSDFAVPLLRIALAIQDNGVRKFALKALKFVRDAPTRTQLLNLASEGADSFVSSTIAKLRAEQ